MTRKFCGNCAHFSRQPKGAGRGCCFMSDDLSAYPAKGAHYAACRHWELYDLEERLYRFPENLKAKELRQGLQLEKIEEELQEAWDAWDAETDERAIEELWDVIQACEGMLRKYPAEKVWAGRSLVISKCENRGDYAL